MRVDLCMDIFEPHRMGLMMGAQTRAAHTHTRVTLSDMCVRNACVRVLCKVSFTLWVE